MADLIAERVTKEFPTRGTPLVVLAGCSLSLSAGQNSAILGPSGSGKSTLLQILGGLDTPTSGSISLMGQNPFALDEPSLARFRNRTIGFVFQDHHLLPQCTVLENVVLPGLANGPVSEAMTQRARELLNRVGIGDRVDHRPSELSGGERQRAAIARALISSPTLLLADEPTGNLDRANATKIGELLLELQRETRAMLVVVTHSLELAARMDRRFELDGGVLREAS